MNDEDKKPIPKYPQPENFWREQRINSRGEVERYNEGYWQAPVTKEQ
jgi:hypothetical protein